jgi:hypothetical protein
MKQRERKKRMLDTPEAKKIFKTCHRFLTHEYLKIPWQVLSKLAETADPELLDSSGQEVVESFQGLLTRVRA